MANSFDSWTDSFRAIAQEDGDSGNIYAELPAIHTSAQVIVASMTAILNQGSASQLNLYAKTGANRYYIKRKFSPSTNDPIEFSGLLFLDGGETVGAEAVGVGSGSRVTIHVNGVYITPPPR